MRKATTIAACMAMAGALIGNGLPDNARWARARANYEALVQGRIVPGNLTQQERDDIVALDRALREGERDTRTPSQRCVEEEISKAGGSPSFLERRVIDTRCREAGD